VNDTQPVAVPTSDAMTLPPLPVAPVQQTVQQAVQAAAVTVSGTNAVPDEQNPDLQGFAKLSAELRTSDVDLKTVEIPFGRTGTLRIYADMPASFALHIAEATADPMAAFRAIREAVIDEDKHIFDEVRGLSPQNERGITGKYLVGLVVQLSTFYGGRPLDVS